MTTKQDRQDTYHLRRTNRAIQHVARTLALPLLQWEESEQCAPGEYQLGIELPAGVVSIDYTDCDQGDDSLPLVWVASGYRREKECRNLPHLTATVRKLAGMTTAAAVAAYLK